MIILLRLCEGPGRASTRDLVDDDLVGVGAESKLGAIRGPGVARNAIGRELVNVGGEDCKGKRK